MSHRQIMEALSGLLLGLFVAILSGTVVSNALPVIVPALGGGESGYTWVVTASLLATTVSTPIWGKLSDLFSKKTLVQIALVIFVVSSAVAGLSQNVPMLITCRVFQGLGAGGLTALVQVILAAMIPPRERGRYSGYLGATFALATVAGPLIGGALTEHLSWHWCFYVSVPFAILSFILLQFTLHLPVIKREVHIDYVGAVLIAAGVSGLLVWVSLAGVHFAWASWETAAFVGGSILVLVVAAVVESKVAEPIIPLRLFRIPTVSISAVASMFVGVALFGATVFLSQYFQLARGESPTRSGLMTLPLIFGLALSSFVAGQFITRTGRWKGWIVVGGLLLTVGLALMTQISWDTDYWLVGAYMALIGIGLGMMNQNLVLAVQNVVSQRELGAASSTIAFTRSLGGAIGVSALGAVLANRVLHHLGTGLAAAHISGSAASSAIGSGVPQLDKLAAPVRRVVQVAYGSSIADIFWYAAPCALVAFVLVFFFKEVALRSGNEEVQTAGAGGQIGTDRVDGQASSAQAAAVASDTGAGRTGVVSATTGSGNAVAGTAGSGAAVVDAPQRDGAGLLSLSGTVRQDGGRPMTGAAVTLADATGQQVARTAADDAGRYHFDLTRGGTYLLIVAAEHVQPSATLVAVGDTARTQDVVLSGTSSLTGRVLARWTDGQGISPESLHGVTGALVTLTDVRGDVVASTTTDEAGGFAFDQLMGGGYVLTAQSGQHRPLARSVQVPDAGAVSCDLRVSSGGRLTGTVVAASDGHRVPEASVTLVDSAGAVVASTLTTEDGAYAFDDLAAGRFTVTAAGYAPVATSAEVAEDEVTAVDVELGPQR